MICKINSYINCHSPGLQSLPSVPKPAFLDRVVSLTGMLLLKSDTERAREALVGVSGDISSALHVWFLTAYLVPACQRAHLILTTAL